MDCDAIAPLGVPLLPVWADATLVAGLSTAAPRVSRESGAPCELLRLAQWYVAAELPGPALASLNRLRRSTCTVAERAQGALIRSGVLAGYTAPWAEHPGHAWAALNACDVTTLERGEDDPDLLLTRAVVLLADGRMSQAIAALHRLADLSKGVMRALASHATGLWHVAVGDGPAARDELRHALKHEHVVGPLRTRMLINLASAHLISGDADWALSIYREASKALRHEHFGARTRGVLAYNAALALARLEGTTATQLALRRARQSAWLLDAATGVRAEQTWAQLLIATLLRRLDDPHAESAFMAADDLLSDVNAPAIAARLDIMSADRALASGNHDEALGKLVPALLLAMSARFDVPGTSAREALLHIRVEPLYERVLDLALQSGRDQLAAELIAFHRGGAVRDVTAAASLPRGVHVRGRDDPDGSMSRPAPPTVIDGRCDLTTYLHQAARRFGLGRDEVSGPEGLSLAGPQPTLRPVAAEGESIQLINTLKGEVRIAPPGRDLIVLPPRPDGRFWFDTAQGAEVEVTTINGVRVPIFETFPPQPNPDFPEQVDGVVYVVPQLVARALPDRRDLVFPWEVNPERSASTGLARANRAEVVEP